MLNVMRELHVSQNLQSINISSHDSGKVVWAVERSIRITCLCNEHPLTPNFYIEKVGFTGVYIIFLFFSKT